MSDQDARAGKPYAYTPITAPASRSWPDGKRLAVYVAVGIEEYRFGDGHTEDLLPASPHDLVNTSWRDYGNRVGGFRLLDKLAARGIPPTVLLNTDVYRTAPAIVAHARGLGAELIGHGISNSDSLAEMTATAQAAYVRRVADEIEEHEGTRPLGWSSPWLAHTPQTTSVLSAAGYRYLLDLRADDRPVPLLGTDLTAMPYALELNDSTTVIGRGASAAEFADMIIAEFEELLEASEEQPLVMSIVTHAFISGAPFRLRELTRALDHLAGHHDQVWFTQPGEIWRREQAGA
jgi:peptidoglycan/xylan/chitin deacetylase (PgdA/CDA1 family)